MVTRAIAFGLTAFLLLAFGPSGFARNLFTEDFDDGQLGPEWLLDHPQQEQGAAKPEWVLEDGVLKQTNPQPGDPTYAVIQGDNWPESFGVMAMVRIDEWQDHDRSRAGLGVWLDPNDFYNGYTWLIHERLTNLNMEFLNDHRAWFQQEETFPVEVGQWYWMKVFIDDQNIYGKIWSVDDPEPDDWLSVKEYANFGAVRQPTPLAGLNGGAGTTGGHSTASFDNVIVFDEAGPEPLSVEANGKLATIWALMKKQ
ncbi:MAG: hypothetical protein KatS3mg115_2491 [Candidatus Poribacteria bacterium]|nr:MAG: hypothetical protein KatS3mg115_2491 [Candidatus Poribacteria bacterium]